MDRMAGTFDFAVIGGGAAGLAAATVAAECGDRTAIFEKNNAIGRKISASGNGRCNLMNSGRLKYFGDSAFAEKVFQNFSRDRLQTYWATSGIRLSEEIEGRLYPCTYQSATVTDAFKIRLKTAGVSIFLQYFVKTIRKEKDFFVISTEQGDFRADRVLISCGGSASTKLGGSENGYRLLETFGHEIIPPKAALCPLTTDSKSISGLSGIRVKGSVTLKDVEGNILQKESGEILFTETGISGICVMQMARWADPGALIELDFAGRIFADEEELMHMLIQRQKQVSYFTPEVILSGVIVPKLAYAVLKQAGIEMKGRKAGDLRLEEIRRVAEKCFCYRLTVTGNRGLEEAQVTAGGADCSEFNPRTMESYRIRGLHAAGEVLNVDGDCGGYNLMFATASGILAGLNGRKESDI